MEFSYRDLFKALLRTWIDDLKCIAWILPLAIIIGYCIFVFYTGISLVMENREKRLGRYQGLAAISYVEDSNHEDAVGEVQRQKDRVVAVSIFEVDCGELGRGYAAE